MTEENRHWWEKPTRDDKIRDPLAGIKYESGMKFDSGKLDYTLVPWDGMEEVIKVLEFGAKKYARDNWKHVENADIRYLAAAFRHIVQYNNGEMTDKETGLSHLAHAGCCLLFLLSLEKNNDPNLR